MEALSTTALQIQKHQGMCPHFTPRKPYLQQIAAANDETETCLPKTLLSTTSMSH